MKPSYFLLFMALLGMASCRTSEMAALPDPQTAPAYTITYLIHGDANYLYHDAKGNALQADKKVLAEARYVAEHATHGEVFIFHMKPETRILWLFPRKDRRMEYYRNGKRAGDITYSPQGTEQPFQAEAMAYHALHQPPADASSHRNIILYYGHEVPETPHSPYFISRPNAVFDIPTFTDGLQSFLSDTTEAFDLTVLSSCNNGTPRMISALQPFSDLMLASPQNLHLSHIDSAPLAQLEESNSTNARTLANEMARETYTRLSAFLQTVITLSVYDSNAIAGYLPRLERAYEALENEQPTNRPVTRYTDCACYMDATMFGEGVQTWYKPPRFGVKKTRSTHSGWGCPK